MPVKHDIIVVGASAGGVEALKVMVRGLAPDLQASVFVTLHTERYGPSILPDILSKESLLPASHGVHGEVIEQGRIYIAPPNHHMLVHNDRIILNKGANANRQRPAIDPLFRSAAKAYGTRVVGVVPTGCLDDGTAGLMAVKRCGGIAIVQNPDEASYPEMPRNVLKYVEVDHVVHLQKLGSLLTLLAKTTADQLPLEPLDPLLHIETSIEARGSSSISEMQTLGRSSPLVCPECDGALWELEQTGSLRFRCHTGHSFTESGMLVEKDEALERALWSALRALEEKATLSRRLSKNVGKVVGEASTENFSNQAIEAEANITTLRNILLTGKLT